MSRLLQFFILLSSYWPCRQNADFVHVVWLHWSFSFESLCPERAYVETSVMSLTSNHGLNSNVFQMLDFDCIQNQNSHFEIIIPNETLYKKCNDSRIQCALLRGCIPFGHFDSSIFLLPSHLALFITLRCYHKKSSTKMFPSCTFKFFFFLTSM